MSKKLRGNLLLLLTALIWGSAFVAQSAGMDYVQPFTYNGIRLPHDADQKACPPASDSRRRFP